MQSNTQSLDQIDRLLKAFEETQRVLQDEALRQWGLPPDEATVCGWIEKLKMQQRHSSQRFTIMLLGEFNVGKSTLLNALLQLPIDRRLPVGDEPTTAKPIRLSYRHEDDPEARWLMEDDTFQDQTWEDALTAGSQPKRSLDFKAVREVQVFLQHDLLYQADILDMPGTGTAWHQDHNDVTREYITNAEMILWVIGSQEPSREGLRDFKIVRRSKVPVTVIFNCWGTLDESMNEEYAIGQEAIEKSVHEHFSDAFQQNKGFRVYANKYLEALEQRRQASDDFGMDELRSFLQEEYVGEAFAERAQERRENVKRQVEHIAEEVLHQLERYRERWKAQLKQLEGESSSIEEDRVRVNHLEREIDARIRGIASEYAQRILEHIGSQGETFINRFVAPSNLQSWKTLYATEDRRKKLRRDLTGIFESEYLYLEQKDNWFDQYVNEFWQQSWQLLQEKWERFLEQDAMDIFKTAPQLPKPDLPFNRIYDEIQDSIADSTKRIFAAFLALGVLVVHPAMEPVAMVFSTLLTALGTPQSVEKRRKNAIQRFRNELNIQRDGLKNKLADLVMGGAHAQLRGSFRDASHTRLIQENAKVRFLTRGIEAIDTLCTMLAGQKSK